MADTFDIRPSVDAVLNADGLVKFHSLSSDSSRFDAGENSGFFEGNAPGGVTFLGAQDLLVDGSLLGGPSNHCIVEVAGLVVVTGDLRHTRVSCRALRVGGSADNCDISAVGDVVVAGALSASRLLIGDYQQRQRRIEELRHEMARTQEDRAARDRRITQDERRLDRSCKATRVPLKFAVTRLIFQEHNRIRVSLTALYESLGDQGGEKQRKALNEFFAKGVIGYLAKANRKYIADNPAREKVFLQLLKALRELVLQVYERDLLIAASSRRQAEMEALVTELREQDPAVHVGASLTPESRIEFVLPRVQRLESNELNFIHQSAVMTVKPGDGPDQLKVETTEASGDPGEARPAVSELRSVSVCVDSGAVVWRPAPTS